VLECAARRQQQERGANQAASNPRDDESMHSASLLSQLWTRRQRRSDATEHEGDRVRDIGGDRREPGSKQGRIADEGGQSGNAPDESCRDAGGDQQDRFDAGHNPSLAAARARRTGHDRNIT
jgi:hypothetical protein